MEDYSAYIQMIDGVAYINKQTIDDSTTLTDAQKAELQQLYALYEGSNDQIKEVVSQLDSYIEQIVTMEKERKEALISINNEIKEALVSIDQTQIDNLNEKYSKMSELDSKYYSELSKKVSEYRAKRDEQGATTNLAQQQRRLALISTDTSGAFTKEIQNLKGEINQLLQAQSDKAVDTELKRIEEEQKQRQEDRDLQVKQLEELMAFNLDNGIYSERANEVVAQGVESIIGVISSTQDFQQMLAQEQQQKLDETRNEAITALTPLEGISNSGMELKDSIASVISGNTVQINDIGIVDAINSGTTAFLKSMDDLFKYLNELLGKKDAGSTPTGVNAPGNQ